MSHTRASAGDEGRAVSPQAKKRRRNAVARALLLLTISLAVLTWASLRANAAWQFLAARSIMETQLSAATIDQDVIEAADQRVQRALEQFPANPDYLDLAGQLRELRANQPGVVGVERRVLLHAAADYYRRALVVRPLWPYSWANLLGVKSSLGEVDAEFRRALARSDQLGPWEPRVQLRLLEAGLKHWDELGEQSQDRVQRRLAATLTVQPQEAFVLVRGFGRADLLCALPSRQPQIKAYCAEWRKAQEVSGNAGGPRFSIALARVHAPWAMRHSPHSA